MIYLCTFFFLFMCYQT